MPSLEQSIKDQFAKVFASSDWIIFKNIAEINLREAAFLKKSSFKEIPKCQQLLIRNTRKRLLIGIGSELLIKAVYLRSGYGINKPSDKKNGPKLPYKLTDVKEDQLDKNDTHTLDPLIAQLKHVVQFTNQDVALDGLKVAKVFRNKEGHVVTGRHKYDPSSYRAIEAALIEIYACAFNQELKVLFSFAPNEKGLWRVL